MKGRGCRSWPKQVAHWRRRAERLQARVSALEAENARLRAELAAARKHSGNSSKPPSTDITKPARRRRRGQRRRRIGGQPGHPRHERTPFPADQVDARIIHAVAQCVQCGSRALEPQPDAAQIVQQVELLAKPVHITEHVIQACRCTRCQCLQSADLPAEVAATGLLGPRLMALLLFLKGALRCSYTAIEEFLGHVLGVDVCRGYLAKVMARGARVLQAPVEELQAHLPAQRVLNVDETGHKENGQGLWTWCFRAPTFVLFRIEASRGSEVLLDALGVEFNGVLGCDYFSAYRKFMGQMNGAVQFCFAHLIRDLKFLAEHPEPVMQVYAQPILEAVRRLFHTIHAQTEHPQVDFASQLRRHQQRILTLAVDTARLSPLDWYVQRHYPEAHTMAQRFRQHGEAYFTFLTTPGLGPTNNAAEQALRFVVMDRRATQGTRSPKGRTFCERIWTVVATCRMQRRSIFGYLCEAVTAWAKRLSVPSLLATDSS